MFAVDKCVRDLMQELKDIRRTWTWSQREQRFKTFTDVIGLQELDEAERRDGVV